MGTGPSGSGVTISKPEQGAPRETYAERELRLRIERRQRLDAHQAAQQAFLAERAAGGVKMEAPHEDKALPPPPEDKVAPVPEKKLPANPREGEAAEDLAAQSKRTLMALAEDRGVTVTRADGRTDLEPTKSDYVRALA